MSFRVPIRRGERHPFAKIPDAERVRCRERFIGKEATITELAREHSVTPPTMHRIVHDPRWNRAENPLVG